MYLIHKEITAQDLIRRPTFMRTGMVRLVAKDLMGVVVNDSGWIKNAETQYGLDYANNSVGGLDVGSGGTPTNLGMTNLESSLTTGNLRGLIGGAGQASYETNTPPYAFWNDAYTNYDPGVLNGGLAGTIREVGLFDNFYRGNNDLMHRVVIPDFDFGPENDITVYYRMEQRPYLQDYTGQIVVNGVTYDYVSRMVHMSRCSWAFAAQGPYTGGNSVHYSHPYDVALPNQDIDHNVPPGASMSGWQYSGNLVVDRPARKTTWECTAYLNTGNFADPFNRAVHSQLIYGNGSSFGPYIGAQLTAVDGDHIGKGIPKLNTQYLTLGWELHWGAGIRP